MKLTEDIVEKIAEADTKVLWEHFNLFDNRDDYDDEEAYEEYKILKSKIWFGFDIKFSIFDIWEERIILHGDHVIITDPETMKKYKYPLEDYRKEKLKRVTEMRSYLYKNMTIIGTMEGR